ncbi:MAG: hypothetical protein RBR40_04975 [Tenuifilaceae bacterium]|nr:hypothetical protein [Tenuifilaceae bacterium]
METKKFTQFGAFSVAIMLPLFLLFLVLLVNSGLENTVSFYFNLAMALIFLSCLLIFYKITIEVDSTHVSFKLGIGLIRKTYSFNDLKQCKPVVNSPLYGIGIRAIWNGWLYNVSGLKSIELQFVSSKSVVRIGTNKPNEISQLIQSRISGEIPNYTEETKTNKWVISLYVLAFLLIFALAVFPVCRETKVQFNDTDFKIKGAYGETIKYSDIELIDTVSTLPNIAIRTNGYALGKTLIGNFRMQDNTNVKLFIKKGGGPYILIKSKGNKPIYLNYKSKQKTVKLFEEIKNREIE